MSDGRIQRMVSWRSMASDLKKAKQKQPVSVREARVPHVVCSGIGTFLLSCDVSTSGYSQQLTSAHHLQPCSFFFTFIYSPCGKDDFCLIYIKKAAFWDAADVNKGVTLTRGVSSHQQSF